VAPPALVGGEALCAGTSVVVVGADNWAVAEEAGATVAGAAGIRAAIAEAWASSWLVKFVGSGG
jgi:hypothetical protein